MSGGPAISPRSLVYVSSTNSILHFRTYKIEIDFGCYWLSRIHSLTYYFLRRKRSLGNSPVGKSGVNTSKTYLVRNKNVTQTSSLFTTSLNSLWTLFVAILAILDIYQLLQQKGLRNSWSKFLHVSTSSSHTDLSPKVYRKSLGGYTRAWTHGYALVDQSLRVPILFKEIYVKMIQCTKKQQSVLLSCLSPLLSYFLRLSVSVFLTMLLVLYSVS